MTLRIGNGAGFLGDRLDAPRRLVESADVDYLTLDYLAELTMSILARLRQKAPDAGYAADFLEVLKSLCPALSEQTQLRIITNGGGVNPRACARAAAAILCAAGLADDPIAVVSGDDLLGRLDQLRAEGCTLENLETGQPLAELAEPIISVNAYLGARPITDALAAGGRIIITGRVADVSLTVGPAVHAYGWAWDDWNRLAAASVAGHLIECGAQVAGGYSSAWKHCQLADVGYPIAELAGSGEAVITKPPSTGGTVTRQTVVEQLVYEIGDPARYLTPDVVVDFTSVEVQEVGKDRVSVRGATGAPAPDSYKVSLAYHAGYTASAQLLLYGGDLVRKAEQCAQIVLDRVRQAGFSLSRTHVEYLGTGQSALGGREPAGEVGSELVLHLAAQDPRREAVERFTKEIAPLITSGPGGLAGYATGRSPVRPTFAFWPTTVPKDLVEPAVEVHPARDWLTCR